MTKQSPPPAGVDPALELARVLARRRIQRMRMTKIVLLDSKESRPYVGRVKGGTHA